MAEETHPTRTFLKDKNGREILFGDHVLDHDVSKNTREEYWNGIYEVCWQAPSFYLKQIERGEG